MTRCATVVVAALLLLVGCGDDDDAIDFEDYEVVTDDGAPVVIERGASFFIELEANPSTGYQWVIVAEPDPTVARVVTVDYVPDTTQEPTVGSGGVERLEVEAVGEGTTTLEMEYRGPGDDGVVEETNVFTIEVIEP